MLIGTVVVRPTGFQRSATRQPRLSHMADVAEMDSLAIMRLLSHEGYSGVRRASGLGRGRKGSAVRF